MTIRIYLQSEFLPDVKLVEIGTDATMDTLFKACRDALPSEARGLELHILAEMPDDDSGEKSVEELLRTSKVIRLHAHRCEHVRVTVRYNGQEVHHEFRPSSTIGRIKKWAAHAFHLRPEDAAEHILQVAGTTEQPDVDVHVGALTKCPECSVTFDLVPSHRINGGTVK